jgi:hypothetical protein
LSEVSQEGSNLPWIFVPHVKIKFSSFDYLRLQDSNFIEVDDLLVSTRESAAAGIEPAFHVVTT